MQSAHHFQALRRRFFGIEEQVECNGIYTPLNKEHAVFRGIPSHGESIMHYTYL